MDFERALNTSLDSIIQTQAALAKVNGEFTAAVKKMMATPNTSTGNAKLKRSKSLVVNQDQLKFQQELNMMKSKDAHSSGQR